MKIIKTAWENFGVGSIRLGRQGENLVRRLKVDISAPLEAHPDADFAIRVESPAGVVYNAAQTVQEDEWLLWDITDADTAVSGEGSVQIVMIGDGEEIAKTAKAKTVVLSSLGSGGEAPDPVKGWLDEAQKLLEDLKDQGSVSEEEVRQIIADWMAAHPVTETDPTVPEWAKQPQKPTYTAAEVGAVSTEELETAKEEIVQDVLDQIPQGGGGGLPTGGAPHQQLVTDGDGNAKWEDRLCYEEEGAVLLDDTITFDDGGQGMVETVLDIAGGNTYNVYWNGTVYQCKATLLSLGGETGVLLGNFGVMTGSAPTGEPFVIVAMESQGTMIVALDGSASATVKIAKVDLRKLPEKFYDADPPYIDLAAYGFGEYDGEDQHKTFGEIGLSEQEVLELRKKAEKLHAVFAVATPIDNTLNKCFGTANSVVIDGINFIYYTIIVGNGSVAPNTFTVSFVFNPDGSGEIYVRYIGIIEITNT